MEEAQEPQIRVAQTVDGAKRVSLYLHPDDFRELALAKLEDGINTNTRIRAMIALWRCHDNSRDAVNYLAQGVDSSRLDSAGRETSVDGEGDSDGMPHKDWMQDIACYREAIDTVKRQLREAPPISPPPASAVKRWLQALEDAALSDNEDQGKG